MTTKLLLGLISVVLLYFAFPSLRQFARGNHLPMVKMKNLRVLYNVEVVRTDVDGFVISTQDGISKIWNQQVSPESFAELRRVAPPFITPTPRPALIEQTPTPGNQTMKGVFADQ